MTYSEFEKKYRAHDGETPYRKPLKYGGYEITYENGDVYRYTETLKPGIKPRGVYGDYYADDFISESTWNVEPIII